MKEVILSIVETIGYILFILAIFAAMTGMVVSTFDFSLGFWILLYSILLLVIASVPTNIRNL
tara:strand:+ start:345 stop:530 length:186 start_codon:yes stop_codon:yes gene_type:complete